MAKLAVRPRRRRRLPNDAARSFETWEAPARARLVEDLRAAGVKLENAPPSALADFMSSHAPPRDDPALRPRGHRSKRNRDHARMLER
jgi:hypothetical protein